MTGYFCQKQSKKIARTVSVFASLAVIFGISSPVFAAKPAHKFDEAAYSAMVAKAQSGAEDVDYLALRTLTSARLSYAESNWDDWRKADELVEADPAKALAMARTRMEGVWTDFLPHIVAQIALEKLGKAEDAEREKAIVGAILRSISGGHKGTSDTDSFNAVSVAEEYRTLGILRWKVESQSLNKKDKSMYDVFKVTDMKTGETRQVWFNIDIFFGKEFGL